MLDLQEKYIIDKNNKPVAVQLDIKTFERLEEVLENYALAQYMKETEDDDRLNVEEAKTFYNKLVKK